MIAASLLLATAAFIGLGDPKSPHLDELTVLVQCQTTRLPAGGQFTLGNTLAWLGAIGFMLAALWERDSWPKSPPRPRLNWRSLSRWSAPAAICFAGAIPLFYLLAGVPSEMTSDHAEKLLDAQVVLDGYRPIFFPCNTGREAMQFYLIALMAPITGLGYFTMKLGTAFLGWLSLPVAYQLARVLAGNATAIATVGVMGGMRWLWQVSRVGLRFPFPPLFGGAVFWLAVRALATRRRNDFLVCGLVLGVAQHTYTALRVAPLAVAGGVAVTLAADLVRGERERARRLLVNAALLALLAGLVALPLMRYAYDQPQTFLFRSASRITSDSLAGPPAAPLRVLLTNVWNALLMFNWRGDLVWVNAIPGAPALEPVHGALFLLGAITTAYAILVRRETRALGAVGLLLVGLLPSIASLAYPLENPSTVRAGMAIPVVALIAAIAVMELYRATHVVVGGSARVVAPLAATALITAAVPANVNRYFHTYARQHLAHSQQSSALADAVRGFISEGGRREDAFVLPWAHWVDWRLVAIQAGDINWHALVERPEDVRRTDGTPGPRMVLVHPDDRQALDSIRAWYPRAHIATHSRIDDASTPWFVTITIPAGERATAG